MKQKVYIHIFSDFHYTAMGCDRRKLRRDIKRFKKSAEDGPHQHFWLGGGDWFNGISARDKRFDPSAVAPEFRKYTGDDLFGVECDRLVQEFSPIRQWGIGVGMGNHEESQAKYNEFNGARNVARQLDLPYLGYSATIWLGINLPNRGPQHVIMYWHHGLGAPATKAGKLNALKKLSDIVTNADVYVAGHGHEVMSFPESSLEASRHGAKRIINRPVLLVNSGTYLKAYSVDASPQVAGKYNRGLDIAPDYAEKKGYRSSVIAHNGFSMRFAKGHDGNKFVELKQVDWR